MIARMWHGKVPKTKSDAYHQYVVKTGLKDFALTEGNKAAFLLKRDDGDVTHFYTLSLWDSIEAIKKFAGETYEKARYYNGDKEFLLELEDFVTHFEVIEYPAWLINA